MSAIRIGSGVLALVGAVTLIPALGLQEAPSCTANEPAAVLLERNFGNESRGPLAGPVVTRPVPGRDILAVAMIGLLGGGFLIASQRRRRRVAAARQSTWPKAADRPTDACRR